jgi:hypothetical protein
VTAGSGSPRARRFRRGASASADARTERGLTLIETLISVWIIGAVMVAMSGALFTMAKASSNNATRSKWDLEFARYVELVRAAPYIPCAGANGQPTYDVKSGYVAPTGATVASAVALWQQISPTDTTVNTANLAFGLINNVPGGFRFATGAGSLNAVTTPSSGTAWEKRTRCALPPTGETSAIPVQADDGIQIVYLALTAPPDAARTVFIVKRCDGIEQCSPPEAF